MNFEERKQQKIQDQKQKKELDNRPAKSPHINE